MERRRQSIGTYPAIQRATWHVEIVCATWHTAKQKTCEGVATKSSTIFGTRYLGETNAHLAETVTTTVC